jgi:hypothetical protein
MVRALACDYRLFALKRIKTCNKKAQYNQILTKNHNFLSIANE